MLFALSLVLLTAAALWLIWGLRLLPMQDYPEHLFYSQVIATWDDPALDWKSHYLVTLGFRPYMLWYLAMKPLASAVGVEAAGRILLSIYVLLIAWLAVAAKRMCPRGSEPWGALLLFPLAFNQTYFMGFANYLVSIPLLFIAILDLERLSAGGSRRWKWIRHALYLAILLLNHPYTALVYACLALAASATQVKNRARLIRTAGAATVVLALVGVCFVVWRSAPDIHATRFGLRWWPLAATAKYFLLMFSGMRRHPSPDYLCAAIWILAMAALAFAWKRSHQENPLPVWPIALIVAATAGYFILPFSLDYYSYLNLRLAPVCYFAAALLMARVAAGVRTGLIVAACSAAAIGLSIQTQFAASHEVEEILPIAAAMAPDRLFLPMLFDTSPSAIDSEFFYEFHAHDARYYQVRTGGGAGGANVLGNLPLAPIRYRDGFVLPAPRGLRSFSWGEHGAYYDYILARSAPPEFDAYLSQFADLSVRSGPWELFVNRSPARAPSVLAR